MDHPVEVPTDIIYYSRWRDVNWLPAMVQVIRVRLKALRRGSGEKSEATPVGSTEPGATAATAPTGGLLRRILTFYQYATNIPDGIIGWLFPALKAGRVATRNWTPDIVFASAPPFTTLIVGKIIAKRCSAPLVVEFRDRWTEDPYSYMPPVRLWIDRRIENWCMATARHIVTVSDPWAEDYKLRWGKPVSVAYNGFDPDDIAKLADIKPSSSPRLEIVYTGILYPDRRDPTPLFEALSTMNEARESVRVTFYGASERELRRMIDRFGLDDVVSVRPRVSFAESLRLQREADVLLLLQWNNPLEAGNVPGKLFEYIAAGRPVLGIGYEGGVPARILRERDAGSVINDPDLIAGYLRELIVRKKAEGHIPFLSAAAAAGLSRPDQYAEIERSFTTVSGGEK